MDPAGAPKTHPGTFPGPFGKQHHKKTRFLRSFPEHLFLPISIRFPASRGNRTLPKMTIFALPNLPGVPRERVPFSQDPLGPLQSLLLSSWRCPGSSQEGPGTFKDDMKFTKLACSKPRKYVYDALGSQRKRPGPFLSLQGPTRDSPESSPFPSRSPLGTQKGPPGRSGTAYGPPGAQFWPVV